MPRTIDRARRRARAAGSAALLGVLLLSACGTTVASSGLGDTSGLGYGSGGGQLAASQSPVPNGPSAPAGGGPSLGTPAIPGGSAGPGGQPAVPGGSGGLSPSSPVVRGVSGGEVKIGFTYIDGGDAALQALGINGVTFGDTKGYEETIVAHLNATGGIAGRRVVPVFHKYNATATDQSKEQDAACAHFTQDTPVFAVTGINLGSVADNGLVPCLAKAGVQYYGGFQDGDAQFWRKYRGWIASPDSLNQTDWLRGYVDGLARQGFFTPGARIGLLTLNQPSLQRAVRDGLRPALAARGFSIDDAVEFSNESQGVAQVSASVLRFRSRGITHVLFAAPGGGAPLYFMRTAQEQQYHPKYGLSTYDYPAVLLEVAAPPEQLAGSVGIGWAPFLDLRASEQPTPSRATRDCLALFEKRGQKTSSYLALGTQLGLCDNLLMLQRVARGLPRLSAGGVSQGIDALGTSFVTAGTFAARFGAGKTQDGVAASRDLVYVTSCSCFRYAGKVTMMPRS
jgi:hypothetical protein